MRKFLFDYRLRSAKRIEPRRERVTDAAVDNATQLRELDTELDVPVTRPREPSK